MSLVKVPVKMAEPQSQEPSMKGNHENPVSDNHQARSHWKTVEQWYLPYTYHREEGRARVKSPSIIKTGKAHIGMSWPQQQTCKTTQLPADPWALHMSVTGEVADQHFFAFNVV